MQTNYSTQNSNSIQSLKLAYLILVAVVLEVNAMSQTCAPDSMARLSKYSPITHSTSSKVFCDLSKTTSIGTHITNMLNAWDIIYPDHVLKLQFCQNEKNIADDFQIKYNVPYLWVGRYHGKCHCALLFFQTNRILLSNNWFVRGTQTYYTFPESYKWAFTNAYYIWKVK